MDSSGNALRWGNCVDLDSVAGVILKPDVLVWNRTHLYRAGRIRDYLRNRESKSGMGKTWIHLKNCTYPQLNREAFEVLRGQFGYLILAEHNFNSQKQAKLFQNQMILQELSIHVHASPLARFIEIR